MGLLRKLQANFRQRNQAHKRIDDATSFVSYDMTEISHSDEEFDSPKDLMLQSLRERSLIPLLIEPCSSSASMTSEMSDRAKEILSKAFPGVSFEDDAMAMDEDLTQYPDPDDFCVEMQASASSDDEEEEDYDLDKKNLLRGLMIDTSVQGTTPSKAGDNDEFLVHSPTDAQSKSIKLTTSPKVNKKKASTKQEPPVVVTTTTITTASVQPRNKLAHIFTEELSTLYEQDESSSLASLDDDDCIEDHKRKTNTSDFQQDDEVLPNERSIHNRWNHILEMTITGRCADHRFVVMDEAEI
mmetsp:Transcript_16635/g.27573  ORF Transcript_16635/g.27573 Transcript_16635/m.27573 type:complete len:298 (-) Transcript_16635:235-1128(-)|eukprot:CAMPEP_0119024528 /NCGR_PEP_ID=MMETSP1176-20130426/32047_1 /TAXON_ID=265551 /ORGANISM="Synedropsis recta cf, Strain CCMP1620" /LENGTH=297 /DNA_ID=CAMNT_0006979851 /DNA_START=187 /DNA_END=1080 /DNA_ORIENTATION=+